MEEKGLGITIILCFVVIPLISEFLSLIKK